MPRYTVLYRTENQHPAEGPHSFTCEAADPDEAEALCCSYRMGIDVVWVTDKDNTPDALTDYYRNGE